MQDGTEIPVRNITGFDGDIFSVWIEMWNNLLGRYGLRMYETIEKATPQTCKARNGISKRILHSITCRCYQECLSELH